MKKHRYTSLLLAILLLAIASSSCAQESDDSGSTDTTATASEVSDTEELSELEARALITDDLPEKDCKGNKKVRTGKLLAGFSNSMEFPRFKISGSHLRALRACTGRQFIRR